SERMDSLSSANLTFMEESMLKFEHFLNALEAALSFNGVPELNGIAQVDVKKPEAWEVQQTPPHSATAREPREAGISEPRFTDVSRPADATAKAPTQIVVPETTAVQGVGSPREATTEEILRAM